MTNNHTSLSSLLNVPVNSGRTVCSSSRPASAPTGLASLLSVPVTSRMVAMVRRDRKPPCVRALAAFANGFGGDVLAAADALLSDRTRWSPSPASATGYVAGYLAG